MEKILKERDEFERNVASEVAKAKKQETAEELEEVCNFASDVPGLWQHPAVTNLERKEILRCLIEKIVVKAHQSKD